MKLIHKLCYEWYVDFVIHFRRIVTLDIEKNPKARKQPQQI